jgi:hypothetical protein
MVLLAYLETGERRQQAASCIVRETTALRLRRVACGLCCAAGAASLPNMQGGTMCQAR